MYVIEDNIDFYNELIKDEPDTDTDDSSYCLISQTPLLSNSISLLCGHKFNYEPLLNDIKNHKTKFNTLERNSLSTIEIRCPYCRSIQKQLLPYDILYPKIHGVNFFDENIYFSQLSKKQEKWCKGKCTFSKQNFHTSDEIIPQCHEKYVTYIDIFKSFLCYTHKTVCIHDYLKAKKEKDIAAKKKLKEDIALQKFEAKKKLKEDANVLKLETKKNIPNCSFILQKGKNKGNQCSFKCIKNTSFCSRRTQTGDDTVIPQIEKKSVVDTTQVS